MSHLEIRAVTKRFDAATAVDALSLSVDAGETVVLLGPSGCGKTTCLRMVAGFERPDDGEIVLDGRTLASARTFVPPERRRMAVVFQSYALWPHMTVYDNVAYGPVTAKATKVEIRRRVHEVLELVQLDPYAQRFPHQLSGGQQQRVALARALVTEPSLLLLDEPLSNLDTRLREEMRAEVKRIQRLLDVTMIYVTHDQAEALSLADRLVVMNAGRVEQLGTPEDVYRRPVNGYVARALGATNIVAGEVLGSNAGVATVRVFGGVDIDIEIDADAERAAGLTARQDATLSIRPADLRLSPAGPGTRARAIVVDAMFFGDVVQYSLDVPGCPGGLKATGPGTALYRAGDQLELGLPTGAVALLDDPAPARHLSSTSPSAEGES